MPYKYFTDNHQFPHPDMIQKTFDGCWLWLGSKSAAGYGTLWLDNSTKQAHRVSWFANVGKIEGILCHKCENKHCINPAHLYDGTPFSNAIDHQVLGEHSCPGCFLAYDDLNKILRHMARCKAYKTLLQAMLE